MSRLDPSLFELFREEVRQHAAALSRGLLDTEADPANSARVEPLMRAAHSLKGACRIVGVEPGVRLAHAMEDALVAAQHGKVRLSPADIDALLKGTDVLAGLAELTPDGAAAWEAANAEAVGQLVPVFEAMAAGTQAHKPAAPAREEREPLLALRACEVTADVPDPSRIFPPVPPFELVAIPPQPLPLPADHTMHDLFREELRANLLVVANGESEAAIDGLKQIHGAARIIKCEPVVRVAAAVAGFLATVRDIWRQLPPGADEWLQRAVAVLAGAIGTDTESFPEWVTATSPALGEIAAVFERAIARPALSVRERVDAAPTPPPPVAEPEPAAPPAEAVVRVTAQSLTRLMGLAGESLVQARWLPSFSAALLALKRQHDRLAVLLDRAADAAAAGLPHDQFGVLVAEARRQAGDCRADLLDKAGRFEDHAARAEDLNTRLYREVIASRMRPFGDGVHGLPRLVRDMARSLGKQARLVVAGEHTEVDRDILEKLESPLSHLVRNAVDHGIEPPEVRAAAGKPPAGTIRLEAGHRSGMLHVTVADDGSGVDLEKLRGKVIDRGLSTTDVVQRMTPAELLEFLFLPGFSTAAAVTEFSGRGVGLDVVQDAVRKVGGSVRITTEPGRGTTFHLQLPLTLSVIRAVVVDIAGEPYAFPHTRIDRLIRVPRAEVRSVEHRQFVTVDGQNVGLVLAAQLLDLPHAPPRTDDLAVVLLSDHTGTYGLVVDSFRGEQDLVVRPLDPRLGKVPNLGAAAILDDGSPVLIVDAEDLVRSMDEFIQTGMLARCDTRPAGPARKKRVLVVDDSITVREVERQLLLHRGYDVAVAVDGADGWNKVRAEPFDLLVSDIDMPRMTGLQLVAAIRADQKLRDLPVVIVSYKEREEDRLRGLEVGANCYLTKSSFHDNRFVEAIEDLIGPAS
jgi:two-component system, chemotaxis family, sensor histidine kinase and response regulator WspE